MATIFETMTATLAQRVEERKAKAAIRAMLPHDLTTAQVEMLLHVDAESPLGVLADRIGCSRGNLTGVADRLERKGLVERIRSTDDRRVVRIRRTADGDALLNVLKTASV